MVDDNKNHFCYPFKADKVKQIREMTVNNVSKKKKDDVHEKIGLGTSESI